MWITHHLKSEIFEAGDFLVDHVKEVKLWDNYLLVAIIFGTSSKVLREFKELVSNYIFAEEIITDNNGDFLDNMDYLFFVDSFNKSLSSGISSAQSFRLSGSGRSSSFGGGFSGFSGGGSRYFKNIFFLKDF